MGWIRHSLWISDKSRQELKKSLADLIFSHFFQKSPDFQKKTQVVCSEQVTL